MPDRTKRMAEDLIVRRNQSQDICILEIDNERLDSSVNSTLVGINLLRRLDLPEVSPSSDDKEGFLRARDLACLRRQSCNATERQLSCMQINKAVKYTIDETARRRGARKRTKTRCA